MTNRVLTAIVAGISLFCLPFVVPSDAITFDHPCMLHKSEDIARVKANINVSPWMEAYNHLQASQYAQSTYSEHTSALQDGYLKRMDYNNWGPNGTFGQYNDYNNYTSLMYDAAAAYQLSLRYQISGDQRFADTAVRILNAWKNNCKGLLKISGYTNSIPDPNEYLIMIQGHQLANAAELLRDYNGWASEDFEAFRQWMRSVFYETSHMFLTNHHGNPTNMHYWLNWDLACMTTVLAVGILCDDREMAQWAIDYYKTETGQVGYVRNAVPYLHQDPDTDEILGQCQESGRDQGHATLCVSLLGTFCRMALNIGEDLFAYDDYRALKMAEYVGRYNLGMDVPYTPYNNPSYYNPTISASGRGTKRPCWELFYGYAKVRSLPATYCRQWVEKMRSENSYGSDGGGGDYGNTSGGFDQLGYGTLMHARSDSEVGIVFITQDSHPTISTTYNIYNTHGMRVGSDARGLLIQAGRKVLLR